MTTENVSIVYKIIDNSKVAMGKLGDNFDKAKVKALKLQQRLEKVAIVGKKLAVVSGVIGAAFGAMAIASLRAAGRLEQQAVALEVLTGSAETARDLLLEINKVAIKTPFEQGEIIKSTQSLLAFGVASEDVIETFKTLGDIAQGDAAKLNTLTRAYGKVQAKGKASMEEIQMTAEAGVPIIQSLADTLGVTTEEVFKLSSQGKISSEIYQKAMKGMTKEGGIFYQSMIKQSATAEGKLSTFKGNVELVAQAIGKHLLPAWKNILDFLNKSLEGFLNLSPAIKKTIVVIGVVVGAVAGLGVALGGVMAILPLLAPAFAVIGAVVATMSAPVVLALAGIGTAVFLLIKYADTLKFSFMQSFDSVRIGILTMYSVLAKTIEKMQNLLNKIPGVNIKIASTAVKGLDDEIKKTKELMEKRKLAYEINKERKALEKEAKKIDADEENNADDKKKDKIINSKIEISEADKKMSKIVVDNAIARGTTEDDIAKAGANAYLDYEKKKVTASLKAWAVAQSAQAAGEIASIIGIPMGLLRLVGVGVALAGVGAINSIQLADGGSYMVDQPTVISPGVVAGEQNIPEQVDVTPISESGGSNGQTIVNVYLDGDKISSKLLKKGQQNRQEGFINDGINKNF